MSLNLFIKRDNLKTIRQRRRERRWAFFKFAILFLFVWPLTYVAMSAIAFHKFNPTVPLIDYHYHLKQILTWTDR